MDEHTAMIEKARARAALARAARQHKAQQQKALEQQKAQKRRKSAKAASLLSLAASPLTSFESQASQVDLPENVLELVMSFLAHELEPGGVVGPSIVARNLANAALVCSEFYLAARHGFATLNHVIQSSLNQHLHKQQLPPAPGEFLSSTLRQQHAEAVVLSQGHDLPGPNWSWDFWDYVITHPMTVTIPELWKAAEYLGVPLPLPKNVLQQQQQQQQVSAAAADPQQQRQEHLFIPQITPKQHQRLVANVLAAFGLEGPRPAMPSPAAAAAAADPVTSSSAHAAVLRAVLLERSCPAVAWDGEDQCGQLRTAVSDLSRLRSKVVLRSQHYLGPRTCLAKMRKELVAAGVSSLSQLQQILATEQQKADQARQQQEQEAAKKRQQQQQQASRSAANKPKAFSLSSIVIRPREKTYDVIY